MTPEVLVVREHPLPGGNVLVTGVQFAHGRPPVIGLGVYRDGQPMRSMLVHPDGFDALDRILAAHRKGEAHVEEVPERNAVLRIEARGNEIILSRHRDGLAMGMPRVCRADEAGAVAEALCIARSGAR